MKRLFGKMKSERGMVTIEATLSLTTFLFAFMMIYSIITICRTQAKMQVALNNTAQEISQYSYIYGLTGLDESLGAFQEEANKTKVDVNGLVSDTVNVFESIQTVGKDAQNTADKAQNGELASMDAVMREWDVVSADLKDAENNATAVKTRLEKMAKDPTKLLFGMAKLIGSETLEIAKSRLIAEPITRALIQKHLKRNDKDNAVAYCQAMGIVPGSYLGDTNAFNGIDFSNSTLFPYGSAEITLIATYKIKMIQLLPINLEFTITQSASTKGWLHGDKTKNSAADIVQALAEDKDVNSSVWNSQSINERNKHIRTLELEKLKNSADGYSSVSGETYIQAYSESTNTFAFVATCNPMYGVTSIDKIDKSSVTEDIKRMAAQINSATDNRQRVTIKVKDKKGNITTKEVDCTKTPIQKKIVLIVPEDEGVQEYVQSIVNECGYSGMFEISKGYGTGMKMPEKPAATESETKKEEA